MGSKKRIDACFAFLIFYISSALVRMPISSASDTLKPGESIRYWQTLISPGQIVELKFFYTGNDQKRYLGLMYKNVSSWILWVANRDNPISGTAGVFRLTEGGNLMISDDSGSSTILYSGSAASNSTLKLLDSGNLVLRERNSDNQGRILWQSFDHPTNVLLPGMKLGVNLKTGQNWSLNAWLRETDPADGAFSLSLDPNGTNQLFIWQRGELYWTSGVWNGKVFPNAPYMTWSEISNIKFISNEDEHYFTYSSNEGSPRSVLLIQPTGEFRQSVWSDSNQNWVGSAIWCGGKLEAWSIGCVVQKSLLNCSKGDEFLSRRQAPLSPPTVVNNLIFGLSTCEAACKSNCSCNAYAAAYSNRTGCSFWYGESDGFRSSDEKDIYYRNQNFTDQNQNQNRTGKNRDKGAKRSLKLLILLTIVPTMILVSFIMYNIWRRKHKQRGERISSQQQFPFELSTNMIVDGLQNTNNLTRDGRNGPELPIFSFAIVAAATDNFSIANKLGQGGFGPVHKGKLPEGKEIAVKRLSRNSKQGVDEFKNELKLIAKVQHMNLVSLVGCCIEDEEMILIYEYMPNKSLDSFLFDRSKGALLDWGKRANIIEGIVQGLLYLHKYSRLKIIHRDLKASNILLDNEMNPKISDFGLARIFEQNESHANTVRPAGTYGYMAPEYALQGLFSIKSDVFSFGVLLLEIVSGKRCTSLFHSRYSMNLLGYAWELWKDDRGFELIDPLMGEASPTYEVLRYINVALLCVQESVMDRPTMSDIILMLINEHVALPSPKQPAFSTSIPVNNTTSSSSKLIPCSINDETESEIEAH